MAINNTIVASTTTTRLLLATSQQAVTTMIFCNASASTDATVSVYAVPYGSNPSVATQIINKVEIPATETFVLDTERLILENNDAIYAQASEPNTITATISSITTA
jgi:hypothetical protein